MVGTTVTRHAPFGRAVHPNGRGIVHLVDAAWVTFREEGPATITARWVCSPRQSWGSKRAELGHEPPADAPLCTACADIMGRPERDRVVYYAQAEDGLIKIGTSLDPERRAAKVGGTLLATEPGGWPEERARHEEFDADRVRGEWFRPSGRLMAHVAALAPEQVAA